LVNGPTLVNEKAQRGRKIRIVIRKET
jgi:hypothetical protein